MFRRVTEHIIKSRVLWDAHGQDLIEYALMAGFVAVAAGAALPNVAESINQIFELVRRVLREAAGTAAG